MLFFPPHPMYVFFSKEELNKYILMYLLGFKYMIIINIKNITKAVISAVFLSSYYAMS